MLYRKCDSINILSPRAILFHVALYEKFSLKIFRHLDINSNPRNKRLIVSDTGKIRRLESWCYRGACQKNINESDRHDFKFNLSDADNLTKISCAFANTKGGFIVLGVKDSNLRFNIKGIDEDKELAHKFGSKIINAQPSIESYWRLCIASQSNLWGFVYRYSHKSTIEQILWKLYNSSWVSVPSS